MMVYRVKSKSQEQKDYEAREALRWPGCWQSDPQLRHFRQHIPTLCEPSWQKAFSNVAPEKILDDLHDVLLDPYAVSNVLYYGEEIRYWLMYALRQIGIPAQKIRARLVALFSQVPPYEFIRAACHWAEHVAQIDSQTLEKNIHSWEVPVGGLFKCADTQIRFCRDEFEIYQVLRYSGIDPRTDKRPQTLQTWVEGCLWYQWQIVEITSDEGTSILKLELAPAMEGYRFSALNLWNRNSTFEYGESEEIASGHRQACNALLYRLNGPDNHKRRAQLFALCDNRKKPETDHPMAYLTPMLSSLPNPIRSILADYTNPEDIELRLERQCPLSEVEIEHIQTELAALQKLQHRWEYHGLEMEL